LSKPSFTASAPAPRAEVAPLTTDEATRWTRASGPRLPRFAPPRFVVDFRVELFFAVPFFAVLLRAELFFAVLFLVEPRLALLFRAELFFAVLLRVVPRLAEPRLAVLFRVLLFRAELFFALLLRAELFFAAPFFAADRPRFAVPFRAPVRLDAPLFARLLVFLRDDFLLAIPGFLQ
jgi:hypothetical protein